MKPRKPVARETVVGLANFKARCLKLLGAVDTHGHRYVITKRGKPIATVSPVQRVQKPLRGLLRGEIGIEGDIVSVDWSDRWKAARPEPGALRRRR